MARALARGWGEPVLCTDSRPGRAQALVDEVGGEALASNAALAERADVVFLCHKPAQLDAVAAEVADREARRSSRSSAASRSTRLRARVPRPAACTRLMPNTPVEVAPAASICIARPTSRAARARARCASCSQRARHVVELAERLMDVATAVIGVAPAYVRADRRGAGRRRRAARDAARPGGRARRPRRSAGTAALLAQHDNDTLARPPRGHLARRLDGARAGGAGARRPARGLPGGRAGGRARRREVTTATVARPRDRAPRHRPTTSTRCSPSTLICIIAYIVLSIMFSAGVRLPYARWSSAILSFLRDVCEPYLRIFRRFLPMFGRSTSARWSRSFVLYIVWRVVVSAIDG